MEVTGNLASGAAPRERCDQLRESAGFEVNLETHHGCGALGQWREPHMGNGVNWVADTAETPADRRLVVGDLPAEGARAAGDASSLQDLHPGAGEVRGLHLDI